MLQNNKTTWILFMWLSYFYFVKMQIDKLPQVYERINIVAMLTGEIRRLERRTLHTIALFR